MMTRVDEREEPGCMAFDRILRLSERLGPAYLLRESAEQAQMGDVRLEAYYEKGILQQENTKKLLDWSKSSPSCCEGSLNHNFVQYEAKKRQIL